MTPHRLLPYNGASDPAWRHDTIDRERGFGDATRGLSQRDRQSVAYKEGYCDGLKWKKDADPMRFGKEQR